MTKQMERAIGFLLYHKEKIMSRACNFCVRVAKMETSETCKRCKSMMEHPNWKEEKDCLLGDWEARVDGRHEKDFPWEKTLTEEARALLRIVEGSKHE